MLRVLAGGSRTASDAVDPLVVRSVVGVVE